MEPSLLSLQIHPKNDHAYKFEETISNFPRELGWDTVRYMYKYQGFWYYESFLERIMWAQEHFKARSDDIIIASCPKTGTTWLKALSFAIATRTSFDNLTSPLLSKIPHECIPFLELDLANDSNIRDMGVPLVATHIPFTSLPRNIVDSGCKIVYICRDPKDVFVSFWYFAANVLKSRNVQAIPMEDAFELFCNGTSPYGPYWDHVLGYWNASKESPEKILFLKYEEVKKRENLHVKKLADFTGFPFSSEEEDKGVVENIIKMCSFESLSNLQVNKNGKHRGNTTLAIPNNAYFRNEK